MAAKQPLKTFVEKNPIEAIPEIGRNIVDLGSQEASREWRIAMAQMLGRPEKAQKASQPIQGELHEGEEVSFAKTEKQVIVEAAMNYGNEIINAERTVRSREDGQRASRIEEIRVKIVQEAQSSNSQAVTNIKVEARAPKMGVYDENYHEGLLSRIRATANNASEMVQQKAAKKDFNSLAKKLGTKFSLSSERAVAQQVG